MPTQRKLGSVRIRSVWPGPTLSITEILDSLEDLDQIANVVYAKLRLVLVFVAHVRYKGCLVALRIKWFDGCGQ